MSEVGQFDLIGDTPMAVFRSRPNGRSAIVAPIIRLKCNERQQVVCLNHDLTGADVHYTFRTEPCLQDSGANCPLCDAGKPYRWEGYFLGWSPSTNVTAIYAVSEGNASTFQSFFEREETLRGAMVTMSRGARANQRVHIGLMKSTFAPSTLPKDEPIDRILHKIWYGKKGHQAPIFHADDLHEPCPTIAESGQVPVSVHNAQDDESEALRAAQRHAYDRVVGYDDRIIDNVQSFNQINGRRRHAS